MVSRRGGDGGDGGNGGQPLAAENTDMTIESLLTRRITRRENEDVFILMVILTILLLRKVPGSGRYPGMASFLRQRRRRRRQRRTPGRRESSDAVAVLPRYVSVFLSSSMTLGPSVLSASRDPGCQLEFEQLAISAR